MDVFLRGVPEIVRKGGKNSIKTAASLIGFKLFSGG